MADIEKLLTMGLARGLDLRQVLEVGSSDPHNRLEWTDVLQATQGLGPAQYAALMMRANPDALTGSHRQALRLHLVIAVLADERRRHQRAHCADAKGPFSRQSRIVDAALAEYQDPRVCGECKGTGEIAQFVVGRGVDWVMCPRCAGFGYREWPTRRRLAACQAPKDYPTFYRYYADSYTAALRALTREYLQACKAFKARLFGADDDDSTPGVIERRLQART